MSVYKMTQSEGKEMYVEAICRDCFKPTPEEDERFCFSDICEKCNKGFGDEEWPANKKIMYPDWVDTCYRCASSTIKPERLAKLRTRFYFSMRPCGSCSHEIQRYSISG